MLRKRGEGGVDLVVAVQVTEFWMHVQRAGPDDCWPWVGYAEEGYGRHHFDGQMRGAHELALTLTTGEVRSPDLVTCHSCDNPPCCNPKHLRFDTRASNVYDMDSRGGRRSARKVPDDVIKLIRVRRAAGAAQQDLADQYGLSESYVSMVVRGQRRPEAGGPIEARRSHNHTKRGA